MVIEIVYAIITTPTAPWSRICDHNSLPGLLEGFATNDLRDTNLCFLGALAAKMRYRDRVGIYCITTQHGDKNGTRNIEREHYFTGLDGEMGTGIGYREDTDTACAVVSSWKSGYGIGFRETFEECWMLFHFS